MQRRTFNLATGLGALAGVFSLASIASRAWAQVAAPKAEHGALHAGHGMEAGVAQAVPVSNSLLPLSAMPHGAPLAKLALLTNESTQAGVFRARLEAKALGIELVPQMVTACWAYNGHIPGPQIVVQEGDSVEIAFTNSLTQASTIHWHGLPVPPEQDGNPMEAVLPGQTRIYRFTIPRGSAGTYWYHPHAHESAAEQAFRGLVGSFIVQAKDDPLAHFAQQHWLMSDLRLDAQAQIPPNNMMDWMNGREGQFVLINGQYQPRITLEGTQRVRIWNACNARYLNLSLDGCELVVVGTDGGLLQSPSAAVQQLLIAPAERYEVLITAKRNGTATLSTAAYDRQQMMVDFVPHTIKLASVDLKVAAAGTVANQRVPKKLRSIAKLGTPTAHKRIVLGEDMRAMGAMMQAPDSLSAQEQQALMAQMFLVNGKVFDMNRIDFTSRAGEVEEWLIENQSDMDHPFHVHGALFQIVSRHYQNQDQDQDQDQGQDMTTPAPYLAWKDVVNLRPQESVRIRLVQQDKGLRMFHCHILEHEALGMMGMLEVI